MRHLLALLLFASLAHALPRQTLDLSGTWEHVRVPSLDAPPPADGWQPTEVPGELRGHDYQRAWFRRTVEVPAGWVGRRVVLEFGGVKWNSRVFVNGELAGEQFNGYDAFEVDVSAALRLGRPNEIRVGVHDWTGVFDPAAEPVAWSPRGELRAQPRDRVLAPIGGHVTTFGLWDRVRLVATAPVHAAQVSVVPSVRRGRLDVRVTAANPGRPVRAEVRASVHERDGRPVLALPTQAVQLPGGGTAEAMLGAAWPDPRLWSMDDPHLYELRLTVAPEGGVSDEQALRFGFREFWVDGPDFVLNGHKVHLLASSWWPPIPPASDEAVRQQLRALKAANTHVFRTHTQPWPENWYTLADEEGVLMIPEGAVWNDDAVYRLDDPRFWSHYAAHLEAMVRTLGNHPSVVMWSLENEFYGNHINDQTPEREARLAALADAVRAADPQRRPTLYESDLDPGHNADVIGLHYPNEWPRVYQWPNAADWLDTPIPDSGGGGGFWDRKPFLWDRAKPLYIGEYLWIPSNNPDWSTIFLGDEAYRDYAWARTTAKALSWDMQIKAYRRAGVSGHSPWTTIEHGPLDDRNPTWRAHQSAYRRIAAFAREWDTRFFAGEPVTRTFDVYNDTLAPLSLDLAVRLEGTDAPPVRRALGELPPRGHRVETVTFPAPLGAARMRVLLGQPGGPPFMEDTPVRGYARTALAAPAVRAGLYDPQRRAGALKAAGLDLPVVTSLDGDLPPLLVVAPGAVLAAAASSDTVVVGGERGPAQRLEAYVRDGGRLLVLGEGGWPAGLFDLALVDRDSTMAFAVARSHPVLSGLDGEAFKFWRGDHLVSQGELVRPTFGGVLPLVLSGSGQGVNQGPLMEVAEGRGRALLCTLRVLAKLDAEPVAGLLLQRMLSYLAQQPPAQGRAALVGGDAAAREVYDALGLDAERFDALPADLAPYRVVVMHDPPALEPLAARLRAFAEGGGTVVLSHVQPKAAGDLSALGVERVRLAGSNATVTRSETAKGPLAEALLREDLYWLGPSSSPISWSALPRLPDQTMAVVEPVVDAAEGTVYRCDTMLVEGAYAGVRDGVAYLASSGTVRGEVDVPAEGDYLVAVTGWSTPAEGTFAQVSLQLGRQPLGQVYLGSRERGTWALEAHLLAGRQPLELAFINDAQVGGEDRNAFLESVSLVPVREHSNVVTLTVPAAVAVATVGRGRVVIDEIRWEAAPGNERKARRYLASLLTAAGAPFRRVGGVALEGEAMRVQPGLQWNRPQGDSIILAQGGWIEGDLDVRRAGAYRLTVVARGTPAGGVWPHATLTLDGQPLGEVTAGRASWSEFRLDVTLPAGRHTLRLDFDNDLNVGGEDRNLYVDRVVISEAR